MSWLSRHETSERLASDAHVSVRHGDQSRALALFADAAKAETEALQALDPGKTRTRGIIAVSAVSLWFKARHYEEAEQLALQWLSSGRLPAFAAEQLQQLVQAIWTSKAMRRAGVAFLPGQVIVSVKGGLIITGGAPLDLIVEKVQTVQALFYRTVEFLKHLPHRKHGGPSLDIQQACRPWLLQAPPGSYQFSVAIQEPRQPDFFKDVGPNAQEVALHFMSILKASSDDPEIQLPELVPAEDYRGTFLKLARNLAPTGKNFSQVEVRGADDVHGIVLAPETRKSINRVLRPKSQTQGIPGLEEPVELRGVLRGVHLDRDWLELLVDGNVVHVDGVSEAVDDVIGPMMNRPVIVQANRVRKRLRFVDIESEE